MHLLHSLIEVEGPAEEGPGQPPRKEKQALALKRQVFEAVVYDGKNLVVPS